jgi:hypothetical protein
MESLKNPYICMVFFGGGGIIPVPMTVDSHKRISLKMGEKGKIECSKKLKGNTDSKHVHLNFILNVRGSSDIAEVSSVLQAC